ncbi:MAG: hypothetical protein A2046_10425 [Bacteroidetes bacterium GWA2_30_7]|nr:MAG: hypothetical protein A2046_10425 [Bacteroidetes bacterium GWA2_30_7]
MIENNYAQLFDLFPNVSISEWEKAVKEDLKGCDFDKTLVWNTQEGFKIMPCYHNADVTNYKPEDLSPALFPFLRGTKTTNDWKICQDIVVNESKVANEIAENAIKNGAEAVHFIFRSKVSKNSLSIILKNLDLNTFFYFTSPSNELLIAEFLSENSSIKTSINYDPVGYLSINGNYQNNEKDFSKTFRKLFNLFNSNGKLINISGNNFHNCGSSVIQELALSLSVAVEYVHRLTDSGFKPEEIFNLMKFTFAVGNNYFFEIAKLRASRYLWSKIGASYNLKNEDCKMNIHSETSLWNMTKYDPHVNMLRATTEAMSAIIGGTDSLSVNPYDIALKSQNEFSARFARNTQIVLKHESSLAQVTDAAAGSYYIENLTNSIIENAWNLFLEIEENGGYLESFEKGIIQKMLSETSSKRGSDIALKNEKILGTNLYPNALEKITDVDEKPEIYTVTKTDAIFKPLKLYRGAEVLEELRLKSEKIENINLK